MSWKDAFPKENVYYETENGILYNDDVLEVLKQLPDESIDCVITSPPYWALRDYGVEGQLGLEPTFQEYLEKLWRIFDEVYRILKPTGTLWVNLGDTYGGSGAGTTKNANIEEYKKKAKESYILPNGKGVSAKLRGTKYQKCLLMIPERFAIGMIERGWILRNQIIWHKPNCMPQSVKDRFTVDFEKIFFFVKQRKYYFEQILEPLKNPKSSKHERPVGNIKGSIGFQSSKIKQNVRVMRSNPKGRNKRTVWTIATKPFKDAHFAVFPPEIPETCIKAGCPEYVCKKCGKPREKIYERIAKIGETKEVSGKYRNSDGLSHSAGAREKYYTEIRRFKLPKSMQVAFARWLKSFIKGNEDKLDNVFGRNKWLHWVRTDNSGQSLPSPEDYRRLKEVLNLPDDWDKWLLETVETLVDDSGNSYREWGWSEYCSCGCNEWEKGIVLDIFMGSGTTAVVAEKLGRKWIGIELNPDYCEIAKKRIEEITRIPRLL